eukprot:137500-Rhodomonas_salina.4
MLAALAGIAPCVRRRGRRPPTEGGARRPCPAAHAAPLAAGGARGLDLVHDAERVLRHQRCLSRKELEQRQELGPLHHQAGRPVLARSRREVVPHAEEEGKFSNRRRRPKQVFCSHLPLLVRRTLLHGPRGEEVHLIGICMTMTTLSGWGRLPQNAAKRKKEVSREVRGLRVRGDGLGVRG